MLGIDKVSVYTYTFTLLKYFDWKSFVSEREDFIEWVMHYLTFHNPQGKIQSYVILYSLSCTENEELWLIFYPGWLIVTINTFDG